MERWHLWWGLLAILAGGLWLVDEIMDTTIPGPVWAAVFFGTGAVFTYGFILSRQNWWAAIPAGALLGLGGLIAWAEVASDSADAYGASLFLGMLGLGFLAVFARTPENWWGIIPGGVLLSLAALIAATEVLGETGSVAVMFTGFALTFAGLALARVEGHRMRWPIPVAGVLGLLAILFALNATRLLEAWNYIWPIALIGYGVYLVLRNVWHGHGHGPTSGTST
jgi:hypothetical protein